MSEAMSKLSDEIVNTDVSDGFECSMCRKYMECNKCGEKVCEAFDNFYPEDDPDYMTLEEIQALNDSIPEDDEPIITEEDEEADFGCMSLKD